MNNPFLDLDLLKSALIDKEPPVYESTLLKRFFKIDQIDATDIEFFKAHFILLNALYRLADQIHEEGDRLYILLGMIYYRKAPKDHICHYFDEVARDFCKEPALNSKGFCFLHTETENRLKNDGNEQKICPITIRDYYLNIENLDKTTAQDLEDIMSGAFFMVGNAEEIKESLSIMSLPSDYTEKRLKQRYRHLVSQHHPDKNNGDAEEFIKVESAYNVLLKWVRFRPA